MTILIFLLLLGYGWASILPNGCPSNSHVHMLLPHETDCDKYYQCVHGNKVLRDCPRGTLFNEGKQSCAWPNTVECPRPTTIRMTSTTSTLAPTTQESTTQILTTTQKSISDCPSDFDIILKIQNEIDCDKYINCSDGVKISINCPIKGSHLNINVEVSVRKLLKRKAY